MEKQALSEMIKRQCQNFECVLGFLFCGLVQLLILGSLFPDLNPAVKNTSLFQANKIHSYWYEDELYATDFSF